MKIRYSFLILFVLLSVGSLVFAGVGTISNPTGILSLDIMGVGIRHGTPNNLNLGTIQYSPQEQEVTGQFSSGFWVEDMMGWFTGHYTTIQCDGLRGPNGIILTGVYIKAGNVNPILVLGSTGGVYVYNNLNNFQSIYKPLVYIYKSITVSQIGIINRYEDTPIFKVVIPPNTTAGTYKGTITFSLYMNDN